MGARVLSLVERLSLSWRPDNRLKYQHGVETSVLCREVVPLSEGPLLEVPVYTYGGFSDCCGCACECTTPDFTGF